MVSSLGTRPPTMAETELARAGSQHALDLVTPIIIPWRSICTTDFMK